MINGIINVYKERGFTSHDVVAKLRGILHQKKIGHTGTLDPDAVGVLPVCLGSGTKLCDMLTDTDKVYRAGFVLGMSTDTQDTSGKILSEAEVSLGESDIREAAMSFVGNYDQIPPMYSALKVNGKKLYQLAREGRKVERSARRVEIHRLEIHSIQRISSVSLASVNADTSVAGIPLADTPKLPEKVLVTMTVACSKGTYIRTLCDDIGRKLDVGGCMTALERIRAGRFDIEKALRLGDIQDMAAQGRLSEFVTPVDEMFMDLPRAVILEDGIKLLHNGNPLGAGCVAMDMDFSRFSHGQQVRMYDRDGTFAAIYSVDKKRREFKVVKMFGDFFG